MYSLFAKRIVVSAGALFLVVMLFSQERESVSASFGTRTSQQVVSNQIADKEFLNRIAVELTSDNSTSGDTLQEISHQYTKVISYQEPPITVSQQNMLTTDSYQKPPITVSQQNVLTTDSYQEPPTMVSQRNVLTTDSYQEPLITVSQRNMLTTDSYQEPLITVSQRNMLTTDSYQKPPITVSQQNVLTTDSYQEPPTMVSQRNMLTTDSYQETQDIVSHQATQNNVSHQDTLTTLYQQDTVVRRLEASRVVATKKPSSTLQTTLVQAVDGSDIERLGMQNLVEAVRSFAGANIRDYGGIGGIKTVSIRSLGAHHTAVSYDGIAISNIQSGQVDISRFSLDNVEQVSLSIGLSDNIFQTARMFASAGALEITTVRPEFNNYADAHSINASAKDSSIVNRFASSAGSRFASAQNLVAKMKYASFATYNPSLLYQLRLGPKWALSLSGDWLKSKGDYPFVLHNSTLTDTLKRKNSDVNTIRSEAALFGDFGRGGKLDIKGNYYYSERGLPGSVVLYDETANERLWDRNAFAHAKYDVDLSEKWALKSCLKYSYAWTRYLNISELYASGKEENLYTQQEFYGSVATQYKVSDNIRFTLAEDLFFNTLDSSIPECPFPSRWTSLTALAGQYKDARLTITAHLLGTLTAEKVEIGSAAPSRQHLSPAVSLSYKLFSERNIRIRASYKNVYHIPTFNDLYYNRVGNVNLLPERASQFNLGLTWSGQNGVLDYATLSVDGYYNRVKDKIVAIPTLFIWKMMNMGEVEIAGVDVAFSATKRIGTDIAFDLAGNYSYQYAVDISKPEAKNYRHQIPYTPRHSGNVNFSFSSKWVNVSYLVTIVGERYALPQNTEANKIDRYTEHTVSLNRSFKVWKTNLRLQAEVVNIFDRMYDVIQFYPMPGRSFRLTVQIKL